MPDNKRMITQNLIRVSPIKSPLIKADLEGCAFPGFLQSPLPLFSKRDRLYTKEGFTLIEVLIAIFVLAIGIFGVMALFPVGIHQTGRIAKTTIGATSAEIPLAYASYKYPPNDTNSPDYNIQDIINKLTGSATCYSFPDVSTGTVTVSDNYGWSTSVAPIDMINNDGTATTIEETYLFRQQTAIYKNYTTNNGTADFSFNSQIISNVSDISNISVNSFICNTENRIWYRVIRVDSSVNSVTLQQPYEYETSTSASYLVTKTIVGLYNTVLTSR